MSAAVGPAEKSKNIQVRRVQVHSPSQMPADYGTTPCGTMFATTPGGTRIIYDRSFLLECRNSPLARSPLANLPMIPGVTCPAATRGRNGSSSSSPGKPVKSPLAEGPSSPRGDENMLVEGQVEKKGKAVDGEDPQFEMDM